MERVRLGLELLKGLLIGLGGVALLSGWAFFLLDPRWAAGLLAGGAAALLLGLWGIKGRWSLDEDRLCLGRRCFPVEAVEGLYAYYWRPLGRLTPRLRAVLVVGGRRIAVPGDLDDRRGFFRALAERFPVRGEPEAVRAFWLWLRCPEVFRPGEDPLLRLLYPLVLAILVVERHYLLFLLLVLLAVWEAERDARRVLRRVEEALG